MGKGSASLYTASRRFIGGSRNAVLFPLKHAQWRNVQQLYFDACRPEIGPAQSVDMVAHLVRDKAPAGRQNFGNRIQDSARHGSTHGRERYSGYDGLRRRHAVTGDKVPEFLGAAQVHIEAWILEPSKQGMKYWIDLYAQKPRLLRH